MVRCRHGRCAAITTTRRSRLAASDSPIQLNSRCAVVDASHAIIDSIVISFVFGTMGVSPKPKLVTCSFSKLSSRVTYVCGPLLVYITVVLCCAVLWDNQSLRKETTKQNLKRLGCHSHVCPPSFLTAHVVRSLRLAVIACGFGHLHVAHANSRLINTIMHSNTYEDTVNPGHHEWTFYISTRAKPLAFNLISFHQSVRRSENNAFTGGARCALHRCKKNALHRHHRDSDRLSFHKKVPRVDERRDPPPSCRSITATASWEADVLLNNVGTRVARYNLPSASNCHDVALSCTSDPRRRPLVTGKASHVM